MNNYLDVPDEIHTFSRDVIATTKTCITSAPRMVACWLSTIRWRWTIGS